MKKLILLVVVSILGYHSLAAQEIIPFPDLSESHMAISDQSDVIDNHNYSLYTIDYQKALKGIDLEIEEVAKKIEIELDTEKKKILQANESELNKKRTALIQEAELIEDLNKFY